MPVAAGAAPPDPTWGPKIAAALAAAPKPIAASPPPSSSPAETLKLAVAGRAAGRAAAAPAPTSIPIRRASIDHAKPQAIDLGAAGPHASPPPAGDALKPGQPPGAIAGVVETADGTAFEVSATRRAAAAAARAGWARRRQAPKLGLALAAPASPSWAA